MKKELVEVVFDRRKNSEKRGYGFLEVQVYLGRATRKYIMIGKYSPDDCKQRTSPETQALVSRDVRKIIAAMDVLDEERTYDNFMYHFNGRRKEAKGGSERGEIQRAVKSLFQSMICFHFLISFFIL